MAHNKTITDPDHIQEQFSQLLKLVIHGETDLARDMVYDLQDLVLHDYRTYISIHQGTGPKEVTAANVVPSAYFHFSLNIEQCSFCSNIIPRRVVGKGMFITKDYKYKWCEDCATEAHKQHPYYLKHIKKKDAK